MKYHPASGSVATISYETRPAMKAHYELPMSCGTCCNVVRKMSTAAQPTIAELWKELIESSVVNTDGTSVRVNAEPAYV